MDTIIDLDVLRPPKREIKIGGKTVDVGFIPTGITWDIEAIQKEAAELDQTKILEGGEESKKGIDLAIKLCATFCSVKHPEMNEDWFSKNADARQLRTIADEIRKTLAKMYEDIQEYSKNGEAGQ